MLFNDAKCTCNTTTDWDVTISGLTLQWNVSKSNVVIYDGTLIGCFQQERLVSVIYTSGTGMYVCTHTQFCCMHLHVRTLVFV